MSGAIAIVLIILVWLFVLAPWLLRGQKPIRKAGEAFDDTRVVFEGGSKELTGKRRPATRATDVHVPVEQPEPEPELVEETPVAEQEPEVEVEQPAPTVWVDEDGTYEFNDAYIGAADVMHPAATEQSELEQEAEEVAEEDAELSAEDIEFAESRRGRGGFDPVADEAHKADRFQRRKRVLVALGLICAVTLGLAIAFGGWVWAPFAGAAILTVAYLVALRNQVRAEEELRRRRVRQLRRARLGVRSNEDEQLGIPARLRRPGAIVLEIDDESPDFIDLDEAHVEVPEPELRVS